MIAARMAVTLGAPMQMAYALEQMVSIELRGVALEQVSPSMRAEVDASDWPWEKRYNEDETNAFWQGLAAEAGEDCDEEAWSSYLDALPWSQPKRQH